MRLASAIMAQLARRAVDIGNLWVLDGDLGDSYGYEAFAARHPKRFIQGGIAEQNLVSMAAGMAASGALPWVFSFAAFLSHRACDQVRTGVSQTGLPIVLVGSHAGGCAGRNGKTHAALGDIATMAAMPDIALYAPVCPLDVATIVDDLLDNPRSAYIRCPRDDIEEMPALAAAEGYRASRGPLDDIVVVSCGLAASWIEEALAYGNQYLRPSHLSVARIDRMPPAFLDEIRGARAVIVVEDHFAHGGFGDALTRQAGRAPDIHLAWPDRWPGSGDSATLRALAGLDRYSIGTSIQRIVAAKAIDLAAR